MQAAGEQEEHRQQEGEQRNDVEHQRMAHERDVFADAEEFHGRAFPI
jgi:hypothetical protein